jgi:tripartite-type tricarboxylate transporter receptor subunit TctC
LSRGISQTRAKAGMLATVTRSARPRAATSLAASLNAATKAVGGCMAKAAGTTLGRIDRMIPFEDVNRLVGLPACHRLEQRYRVWCVSSHVNDKHGSARFAMDLSRRHLLGTAMAVATSIVSFGFAPPAAMAVEDYPTRPVMVVVPAAPGGIADLSGRLLAEGLTKELGQQFVVENRGGASGNIGNQQVARAEPDGYTLLLAYSGYQVTNPSLFKKLNWDPIRDFVPIGLAIEAPHVIVVRKDLPVDSLQELIEHAKAHPGELNYASPGNGSIPHIGTEQLLQLTGTEMVHIPYKGTGPAMTDLLGGSVDLLVTTPPSAAGHLREQQVKGLALADDRRHPMLPDIPTAAEAGLSGFELKAWTAVYAPAGTPQPIVDKLAAAVEKVVKSEAFGKKAMEQGTYAVHMGPEELGAFTKAELAHWGEVIKKAGITLD